MYNGSSPLYEPSREGSGLEYEYVEPPKRGRPPKQRAEADKSGSTPKPRGRPRGTSSQSAGLGSGGAGPGSRRQRQQAGTYSPQKTTDEQKARARAALKRRREIESASKTVPNMSMIVDLRALVILDGKCTQTPLNIHKIHSVFDLEANTHNTPRRCILSSLLQIH
jgi:hypothetical protein